MEANIGAAIYAAGIEADRLNHRRPTESAFASVVERAWEDWAMLRKLCITPEELADAIGRASQILRRNWSAVLCIADHLLRHNWIYADYIREFTRSMNWKEDCMAETPREAAEA